LIALLNLITIVVGAGVIAVIACEIGYRLGKTSPSREDGGVQVYRPNLTFVGWQPSREAKEGGKNPPRGGTSAFPYCDDDGVYQKGYIRGVKAAPTVAPPPAIRVRPPDTGKPESAPLESVSPYGRGKP